MRFQWLLVIVLSFGYGSALAQAMPDNTDSEYFRTLSCGTHINGNKSPTDIVFYLKLKVKKPLSAESVIVAEFENPIPHSAPKEVVLDPVPAGRELTISSLGMPCLTTGKYYRSIVTLFADATRRKVLSTHVQIIAVFLPQPLLDTLNATCPTR